MQDTPAGIWAASLGDLTKELADLNRETEQEFVRIGGKVSSFIDMVGVLSTELSALAQLISGERGQQASAALATALTLSKQMRKRSEEGTLLLSSMSREAKGLRNILSRFSGTVATFHSLGLLTRIETARLGNAGADFGNLAEDVRLLARNVQMKVDGALETAGELIPRIESAVKNAAVLHDGLANSLPSVIAQVGENLEAFTRMQSSARDTSLHLGAEYSGISDAFKQLIVSMQFNDITRQQVEHVMEVLHRLTSEGELPGHLLIENPGAAEVLELQCAQITNAGEQFSTSVASVLRNLDEIGERVLTMVAQSRSLTGLSARDKNSFFREMEQGCAAILETLSQCANADKATQGTSDDLAETTMRMRGSIEEIRTIERQMLRIGMNARISSAQLGDSGEALSALADSIKQRAFESKESSDLLVRMLDSMYELATHSSQKVCEAAGDNDARETCLADMRAAVEGLQLSQEASASQIMGILQRADQLHHDLAETRASFQVAHGFQAAVSKTQRKIRTILAERASFTPQGGYQGTLLSLADFAGHYTMHSERHVYDGSSPAAADTVGADDGIEFF